MRRIPDSILVAGFVASLLFCLACSVLLVLS